MRLNRKTALLSLRIATLGLICAGTVGIAPGSADNHPAMLREVDATVTGVKLKLLLEQCDAAPADNSANFCTGYIAAAFDQLSLAQKICPPSRLTTDQILDVGRRYLFGHAMQRGVHPGALLAAAFREAYGCSVK